MSTQLKKAIAHIKIGEKKAAKAVLSSLLKTNPADSDASMAMSAVVDTPEMKRKCLEEAIEQNPDNETARKALAKLNKKHPPPPLYAETAEDEEMWLPDSFKEDFVPAEPSFEASTPVQSTTDAQKRKTAALDSFIIRGLAAYRKPEDIAIDLANKGMDYNQAVDYVLYVSRKNETELNLRRLPIVLLTGGYIFILGLSFLFSFRLFLSVILMVVFSVIVGALTVLKEKHAKS